MILCIPLYLAICYDPLCYLSEQDVQDLQQKNSPNNIKDTEVYLTVGMRYFSFLWIILNS